MKRIILVLTLLVGILCLPGCVPNTPDQPAVNPKTITVCAAASLKEALDEIKPKFEQSNNIKLTLNLAASGTLQKQIEEGAPADIFISAGKKQVDALESKNLIDKDSRKDLLKNSLVLIVSEEYKDKIKTAADLAGFDIKIAIGDPGTVPAGQYAKESLTNMNLWDKLSSKMVLAKDVNQVITYVEKGEAAAGIVYTSDSTVIKNSVVAHTFEESTHSPIAYPAAIVSASKDKASAKAFIDYLLSDEAQQVFSKYGFSVITK